MKRAAIASGLLFLCMGTSAHTADDIFDVSGTWIRNDEKSDPSPRVTPIGRAAGPKTPVGRSAGPKQPGNRAPLPKRAVGSRTGNPVPAARSGGTGAVGAVGIGRGIGGGTFDGTSPVARDVPLVITQTGTEIKISNALLINGKNVPNFEKYALDGKNHGEKITNKAGEETQRTIKAILKEDKIEIEVITINPEGRMLKRKREFSLSKDGGTLTVKASSQSPFLVSSEKMVYDRQ